MRNTRITQTRTLIEIIRSIGQAVLAIDDSKRLALTRAEPKQARFLGRVRTALSEFYGEGLRTLQRSKWVSADPEVRTLVARAVECAEKASIFEYAAFLIERDERRKRAQRRRHA